MSADAEIQRGHEAQQILDSPLVKEALFRLKAECLREWENSPAKDTEGREHLYVMYRLAQKFEAHFAALVGDGKVALANLAEIERERKARKAT